MPKNNLPGDIYQDTEGTYRNPRPSETAGEDWDYSRGGYTKPPGPRPVTEDDVPDFAGKRQKFHDTLVNNIGEDPYESNPVQMVDHWDKTESKNYFNKFFQGRISWNDRSRMNNKERRAWNKEIKRKHASLNTLAENHVTKNRKYYDNMMKRFDGQLTQEKDQWTKKLASRKETRLTKDKKAGDQAKALSDVETYTNKILGKELVYTGDEGYEKRTSWKQGDPVSKKGLGKINKYRKAKGLDPLVETEVEGGVTYIPAEKPKAPRKAVDQTVKPTARHIKYLNDNPDTIDFFEAKFGYRPEGF